MIELVGFDDDARVLGEFGLEPAQFAMVGNSLRSDIEPVVALGGWGIYMPYHVTWAHERGTGIDERNEAWFAWSHRQELPLR